MGTNLGFESCLMRTSSILSHWINTISVLTDKTAEERLTKHMTNHGGFTAKAKDWEIVCKSFHETLSGARIQEMSIKKAKSRKVIAGDSLGRFQEKLPVWLAHPRDMGREGRLMES